MLTVTDRTPSPLQAAWWPTREALDRARAELDEETFETFLSMVAIAIAKWERERLERQWRRAA